MRPVSGTVVAHGSGSARARRGKQMTIRTKLARRGLSLVVASAVVTAALGAPAVSATSTPRLTRAAFGFFVPRDSEYMLHEADYNALSTVAFSGLNALADGTLQTSVDGVADPD